jgi:hypothetical protein
MVVVGVLSDEVHPAGGAYDHRWLAELLTEACEDWNVEFHVVSEAEAKMLHGWLRERP